jgi:hypothetical protein
MVVISDSGQETMSVVVVVVVLLIKAVSGLTACTQEHLQWNGCWENLESVPGEKVKRVGFRAVSS